MSNKLEVLQLIETYLANYQAEDAAGCAACYTQDGQILSPYGPPIIGRAAIAAAHGEWFLENEENKKMDVQFLRTERSIGFCLAVYEADVPGQDRGIEKQRGTSLITLERSNEGWKIWHTSLNPLEI